MANFLSSHVVDFRNRFGIALEVATGIVLYGSFLAFMGFSLAIITPLALCGELIERAGKRLD